MIPPRAEWMSVLPARRPGLEAKGWQHHADVVQRRWVRRGRPVEQLVAVMWRVRPVVAEAAE